MSSIEEIDAEISVELGEYYFVGDGTSYDKHYFILNVSVDSFSFSVDRSYVDFVELDRRLRKKFPQSKLPELALSGAGRVRKALQREAAAQADRRKSLGAGLLTSTRTSLLYAGRDSMVSIGGGDPAAGFDGSLPSMHHLHTAFTIPHGGNGTATSTGHSKSPRGAVSGSPRKNKGESYRSRTRSRSRSGSNLSQQSQTNFSGQEGEDIEVIAERRPRLRQYLHELLRLHEVVCSEELQRFLDEEVRCMLSLPPTGSSSSSSSSAASSSSSSSGADIASWSGGGGGGDVGAWSGAGEEPLSVHDLLLINSPVNSCVVARTEQFRCHARADHLVVWRFRTRHFDIGFSVEANGVPKVPLTRYNSHRAPVCGTLLARQNSLCVLKWDNSYAKCE